MSDELTVPAENERVTWLEQRTCGGKQMQPATFLRRVGKSSARIRVDGSGEKTVRIKSLRWEAKHSQAKEQSK